MSLFTLILRRKLGFYLLFLAALTVAEAPATAAEFVCTQRVQEQTNSDIRALFARLQAKGSDCAVAKITGTILASDGEAISRQLRDSSYLLYLDLDSPGGALNAALQIGREVRHRNMLTF